jgi:hemerythrin
MNMDHLVNSRVATWILMRKGSDKQAWPPKVLLEVPELDEDHQRLLGRVNALIAAVASKAPASVQSALSELRSETMAHFAREETLMIEAQYPRLEQHRASHQRLLRALGTLRFALDASGRIRLPLVPMNYIRRWFLVHVAQEDRLVASYLDKNEDIFLIGLA